jgi:GTP-binding protein Era
MVTIVGRPNAGKSTLLNALLGEKLAIVTPKPQTTRDRIRGICPMKNGQLVFVDTPGVHKGKKALNRLLRDVALESIPDVDVILYVRDVTRRHNSDDTAILDAIQACGKPAIAILNKIDKIKKNDLLPMMARLHDTGLFTTLIPVSALRGKGLDPVRDETLKLVPEGPALYPEDDLTDKPVRFLVAELVREQLFHALNQEMPYSVAVETTKFSQREGRKLVDIDATVHVERANQKGIVLGKGGELMKAVSTAARLEIQKLIGQKVNLQIFVHVEPNWAKSDKSLEKVGYSRDQ